MMYNEATSTEYDQMNINAGIRKHGEKAIAAVIKEYQQLKDMDTVVPLNAGELSQGEKREAFELLTLVKKKRCGKLKGRVCANGRKQRRYISREEVSSPTVQLESIIATLLIDAKERRDVAVADVTGAYLKTVMTDHVVTKVTGSATDIMCDVNPSFRDKVALEGKNKVLYMQLNKAL